MRKIIFLSVFLFIFTIVFVSFGYCNGGLHNYTEQERQVKYEEADLVFEGSFVDAGPAKGDITLNAVTGDPSRYKNQGEMLMKLPSIVSFNVEKVVKGECKEKVFSILIHSPTIQFGIDYENLNANLGKKFVIYIQYTSDGRMLIGQEALAN